MIKQCVEIAIIGCADAEDRHCDPKVLEAAMERLNRGDFKIPSWSTLRRAVRRLDLASMLHERWLRQSSAQDVGPDPMQWQPPHLNCQACKMVA